MKLLVFKNSVLGSLPGINHLDMPSNRLPTLAKRLDLCINCLACNSNWNLLKNFYKTVYENRILQSNCREHPFLSKVNNRLDQHPIACFQELGSSSNRFLPSNYLQEAIAWMLLIPETHKSISTIKTIVQILICECSLRKWLKQTYKHI